MNVSKMKIPLFCYFTVCEIHTTYEKYGCSYNHYITLLLNLNDAEYVLLVGQYQDIFDICIVFYMSENFKIQFNYLLFEITAICAGILMFLLSFC